MIPGAVVLGEDTAIVKYCVPYLAMLGGVVPGAKRSGEFRGARMGEKNGGYKAFLVDS
jgi:hypothetical protein